MAGTYEIESYDIAYVSPGGTPLLARMFCPKGDGPFPGVVEVPVSYTHLTLPTIGEV